MDWLIFVGIALLAVVFIAGRLWREAWPKRRKLPADWEARVKGLAAEQARGHHREVRQGILALCRQLDESGKHRVVPRVRTRLAVLLARDAIYTEVVREIRKACTLEPAVSERVLCVGMRDYVLEDVRQCMQLAEYFGQIRRFEHAAEALITANFPAGT